MARARDSRGPDVQEQLDDLRCLVTELRELVVTLLHHHGYEEAGSTGGLLGGDEEERIPLSEATRLIWRDDTPDAELIETRVESLKDFATRGLDGHVLETETVG